MSCNRCKRCPESKHFAQTPFEDMIWQDGLKLKGGRRGTLANRMSTRHVYIILYITLLMSCLFFFFYRLMLRSLHNIS